MSSKPDMVSTYDDLRKSFQDHASSVRALQRRASEEIVPDVQVHEDLDDDEIDWVEEYLKDGGVYSLGSYQACFLLNNSLKPLCTVYIR